MDGPKRIWWARPGKLCALERPGGGGRGHRAERREQEIAWLAEKGVRLVVSTMRTRHNLADYDRAGLAWHHLPVASAGEGEEALEELLVLLKRETRGAGAVAVHGDRDTDFVAAVAAAHLHATRGVDPRRGLIAAALAGLDVTPASARLLGLDQEDVQPRSRIEAATSSGLSVTT